ncbi:MAG: PD40 domain-containing protein [Armatimonadetes bacterium]|nr:PD40 domain-containing protein [Armatimonadota bacterium]
MRILVCLFLLAVLPAAAGAVGGWEAEWSPDGRQIVFTSAPTHGIPNIWVMDADGENRRQLTFLGGRSPQWVPHSRKIHFVSVRTGKSRQYLIDADAEAGTEVPLPGFPDDAQNIVWSPDGAKAAFVRTSSDSKSRDLWVAYSDGSDARGLTTNFQVRQCAWSSDSKEIATVVGKAIGTSLWLIDPEKKDMNILYQGFCSSPAYSPDGRYLSFAIPTAKRNHRIVCLERATAERVLIPVKSFDGKAIKWSLDGKRMLFGSETGGDLAVWTAGLEGRDLVRITPKGMHAFEPSYSPDGKHILFSGVSEDSHGVDIYSCGAGSSVPFGVVSGLADKIDPERLPKYARLTDSRGTSFGPVWSPDGRVLAAAAVERGAGTIYIINERGRRRNLIGFDPSVPLTIMWSPDGKRIAVVQGSTVQVVAASGGKPVVTHQAKGETTVSWSPDSSAIYLTDWPEMKGVISLLEIGAEETKRLTEGSERQIEISAEEAPSAPSTPHAGLGVAGPVPMEKLTRRVEPIHDLYPVCSPDGKQVAFVRGNQIWIVNPETKEEKQLIQLSLPETGGAAVSRPDWSPDGRKILFRVGRMEDGKLSWEIRTVDVETGESDLLLIESSISEYAFYLQGISPPPAFTSDGKGIVFTSIEGGIQKIARLPVNGGKAEILSDDPSSYGSLSSRGKLAYVSLAGGEERVVVR